MVYAVQGGCAPVAATLFTKQLRNVRRARTWDPPTSRPWRCSYRRRASALRCSQRAARRPASTPVRGCRLTCLPCAAAPHCNALARSNRRPGGCSSVVRTLLQAHDNTRHSPLAAAAAHRLVVLLYVQHGLGTILAGTHRQDGRRLTRAARRPAAAPRGAAPPGARQARARPVLLQWRLRAERGARRRLGCHRRAWAALD